MWSAVHDRSDFQHPMSQLRFDRKLWFLSEGVVVRAMMEMS